MFEEVNVEEVLRLLEYITTKHNPAMMKPPFVCQHCLERPSNMTIGSKVRSDGTIESQFTFRGCAICWLKFKRKIKYYN